MMPPEAWATIIGAGIQGVCMVIAAAIAAGWISYWNKKKVNEISDLREEIQKNKVEIK